MTTELVLITNPDEIAALPTEQRGQLITNALVESKRWLAVATKGTDPTPIQEFKAWAATVAEMTRQKGLSEEIQMDAQEMVRRAERGIGLVVQQGQEAGVVRTVGRSEFGQVSPSVHDVSSRESSLPSPKEFYATTREYVDARDMSVDVTDEDFEEVLQEAREEGNLSRRGVAAKARERSGREVVPRDTHPDKAQIEDVPKRKRLPLAKQYFNAATALSHALARLERLEADDRFAVNRVVIAEQSGNQIRRAAEVLGRMAAALDGTDTPTSKGAT